MTKKVLLGLAVAGVAAYVLLPPVRFYLASVTAYLFPSKAPASAPRVVAQ